MEKFIKGNPAESIESYMKTHRNYPIICNYNVELRLVARNYKDNDTPSADFYEIYCKERFTNKTKGRLKKMLEIFPKKDFEMTAWGELQRSVKWLLIF